MRKEEENRIKMIDKFLELVIHLETPVHESSFLERHPPFARFFSPICIKLLYESCSQLLSSLNETLAKVVYSGSVTEVKRCKVMRLTSISST